MSFDINKKIKKFDELTRDELYAIIHLREKVFVVEQEAAYQDTDYKDQESIHVMLWIENNLAAYARVLPAGISYTEPSIGRVVSALKFRRKGLGYLLMKECLNIINNEYLTSQCRISAQRYLIPFYSNFGFRVCSEEYLEDGLPHFEMIRL